MPTLKPLNIYSHLRHIENEPVEKIFTSSTVKKHINIMRATKLLDIQIAEKVAFMLKNNPDMTVKEAVKTAMRILTR